MSSNESRPRTSRLAVAALLLPFLSLPITISMLWVWDRARAMWPSLPGARAVGLTGLGIGVSGLSLALGIVALVRIRARRDRLSGAKYAWEAVVFSVLAGLVWVGLLPVEQKSQESADMSVCFSHMANLGTALQMYLADDDQGYPSSADWCDRIAPYLHDKASFQCPGASRRLTCAYAMNSKLSGLPSPLVGRSATLAVLFESDRGWNGAGTAEALTPTPRHLRVDTWGFADGHVGQRRREEAPAGPRVEWVPALINPVPTRGADAGTGHR